MKSCNSMPKNIRPKVGLFEQNGAALIVVLVILVAMTMAGLAGMQVNSLEERMSSNTRDRTMAFQAAEAALRLGQTAALLNINNVKTTCVNGLCARGFAPDPITYDWAGGKNAVVDRNDASNGVPSFLHSDPAYFIEKAGAVDDPKCGQQPAARVVSRAQGVDPMTVVILESYVVAGCV